MGGRSQGRGNTISGLNSSENYTETVTYKKLYPQYVKSFNKPSIYTGSNNSVSRSYQQTVKYPANKYLVVKVAGKQLSTEDYTTADKTKLSGLSNYTKPASEPISYITGLQTALDSKVSKNGVESLHSTDALRISGTTLSLYKGDGTFESVVTQDTVYTLPKASATVLGGIKVGTNLSIDANGVLSANNTNMTPEQALSIEVLNKQLLDGSQNGDYSNFDLSVLNDNEWYGSPVYSGKIIPITDAELLSRGLVNWAYLKRGVKFNGIYNQAFVYKYYDYVITGKYFQNRYYVWSENGTDWGNHTSCVS